MRVIALMLLAGCPEPAPECIDHSACGEGEVCVQEQCRVAQCLTSDECGFNHFCDQTRFVCREGCRQDGDCLAGQTCDKPNKTCLDAACSSTDVDCPVGTFCDTVTGACYEGDEALCETCNGVNLQDCGNGAYCIPWEDPQPGYCWRFCDTQADCPSGFACQEMDAPYNNICVADCPWLIENGYL